MRFWGAVALFLIPMLAGCRCTPPTPAPFDESTREVSAAVSQFREAMLGTDVALAYRMLSTGAKNRYNLWEYAILMDSDSVVGRLLRRVLAQWDVVAVSCATDRKTAWVILRHPRYHQYSRVLDLVLEHDDKIERDLWRIDFRLSRLMLLSSVREDRLRRR